MSQLTAGAAFGDAGMRSRANEHFPSPWMDMASMAFPDTMQEALRACEDIISANGPYREALRRVISYFITDVEITGVGDKRIGDAEKKKYKDFLDDTIGITTVLHAVALDFLCYGNSFTSLLVPFRRYLGCPGCGLEMPLRKIYNAPEFQFQWTNFQFHASCPHCNYRGRWRHVDRRSGEQDQIKVRRWSPHEIDILHDPATHDTAYVWKIPDDYRGLLRRGYLFHLERASWEILQAVNNNQHLLFDKDSIYHMKEEALAGLLNRGWGISRVLTNFRQAYYVQVLHRYNEAIALDYVIPFRVITPQAKQGQAGEVNDPVLSINLGSFAARVQAMIAARRRDPARWNILPFPVEYQSMGGDATTLAPTDLLKFGLETLLNAAGVPVQLYQGDLTAQTAPSALRLFEANWSHLVHGLNRFLAKLVDKIAQVMSWEPVTCRLTRVTHADDLNRQMAKLQLMMGGQISRTTGLDSLGMEFREEIRRKLEEERLEAEETQQSQDEMEQAASQQEMAKPQDPSQQGGAAPGGAQGGAPAPAGGDPAAGGQPGQPGPMGQPMGPYGALQGFMMGQPLLPNKPTTPEEMQGQAQAIAQQVLQMPETAKDSFLIRLKKEDSLMHSLVTSQLEDMRRQQATQMQAAQQQQQQPVKQATALAVLPAVRLADFRPEYGKYLRGIDL